MKIKVLLVVGTIIMIASFSLSACAKRELQKPAEPLAPSEEAELTESTEPVKLKEPEEAVYHKISAQEAKEMMDQGNVSIVDVRTPQEYSEGHIPGAVNVPNEKIEKTEPEQLKDKDAVLLVYCRSGRRSKEAADKLIELGYTQVYDFGGIIDWTYETVKGE